MAVGYTIDDLSDERPTQHLSAHQSHDTSGLGEPLVPADGDSQLAVLGVPHLETGITGVEVELLLVAGTIRNVGLSVHAQHRSVSINNGDGVVVGLVVLLEEGDGKHHVQLLGDLLEVSNQSAGGSRLSKSERLLLLILAEVPSGEQLLEQNHLSSLGSGLADQLFTLSNILLPHGATGNNSVESLRARHLSSGNSHVSHLTEVLWFSLKSGVPSNH